MKVILEHSLLLGDMLYKPHPLGVELPDTVGTRKVILFKEDYEPKDSEVMLPRGTKEATGKEIEAAPQPELNYPRTLSEATPPANPLGGPELSKTGSPVPPRGPVAPSRK